MHLFLPRYCSLIIRFCRHSTSVADSRAQQPAVRKSQERKIPDTDVAEQESESEAFQRKASLSDEPQNPQLAVDHTLPEASSQAEERDQSHRTQPEPGTEHPSNHEWISETAQRILQEEPPDDRRGDEPSGSFQVTADEERGIDDSGAHCQAFSEPAKGNMRSGEDGCIDLEVLASLPPEIQREVKLASMMKMGALKRPRPQPQHLHPRSVGKPPVTTVKQEKKKKGPNIANYFSAK